MVGLMSATQVPEANCAICGAPPFPECPHEGERLELALNQAWDRWIWTETIRCVCLYLFVLSSRVVSSHIHLVKADDMRGGDGWYLPDSQEET